MKIAEMESHHSSYISYEEKISALVAAREFPDVFQACQKCLPHILPAIKFRKKRQIVPETPTFLAVSVTCHYAPPLFEHHALASLHEFISSNRQLARHEKNYLEEVESAIAHEEVARLVWNAIEQNPGLLQREIGQTLGQSQKVVDQIVDTWSTLGVVHQLSEADSPTLSIRTRMDVQTAGLCPSCGIMGTAPKHLFLAPTTCKKCGANGYYHISTAYTK